MSHPFETLPADKRNRYLRVTFLTTLVLMIVMNFISAPLKTSDAPLGMISYEFVGNPVNAQKILNSWSHQVKLVAAFSLGLDYLFLFVYSTTIALACIWAADILRNAQWPLAWAGAPLAWGQWIAALLDAIENLALLLLLLGSVSSPLPEVAFWAATGKFTLIFLGLIYAIYAWVVNLLERRNQDR